MPLQEDEQMPWMIDNNLVAFPFVSLANFMRIRDHVRRINP